MKIKVATGLAVGLALVSTSVSGQVLDSVSTGPQQNAFNEAIATYRDAHSKANNDLAAGAQRQKRAKSICQILKGSSIKGWTGFITQLSSNSDGLGVLAIETGKGVTVKTWNNALSDSGDKTLLKVDSPVFQEAMELQVGQAVEFSGTFIKDKTDCIRESSLTQSGSMENPAFIMRFTSLKKLGDTFEPKSQAKQSVLKSLFGSN